MRDDLAERDLINAFIFLNFPLIIMAKNCIYLLHLRQHDAEPHKKIELQASFHEEEREPGSGDRDRK